MKEALFQKGLWVGKGLLTLSMLEEPLTLWMRLSVSSKTQDPEDERMQWNADYQVLGYTQPIVNRYTFSTVIKKQFMVTLENELWGKAQGMGMLEDKGVCMEFPRGEHGFEGFESIRFENDTTLLWTGEFLTEEGLRSIFNLRAMKCVEKHSMTGVFS